jgi:sulfopyruvate decarboxylase alpha subunit
MKEAANSTGAGPGVSTAHSWAHGICAGLSAEGCREVVYVPDNPLSHILRVLESEHPDIRTTLATREEEALGIAAGLYLGGARPVLLMQSSGLGNTLNALGSLIIAYQLPVMLIISLRGGPGEWNAAQVPMGRAVVPILEAFGIQHKTIDCPEAAEETVRSMAALAFSTRQPAACLLPRRLSLPGGRP